MSMPGDGNNPKPSSPSQAPEGADGGAPVNQNVSIDSNPSVEPPTIAADENATGAYRPKNDDKSISDRIAKPPAAGSAPKLLPGQLFGRYRIEKELGRGGMGAVFLALDTQLDRKVALKVPSFRFGETEELIVRFYREARAMATVHHPNICPVYDVGEIDGQLFLSMAFIEGRSLSQDMRKGVGMPVGVAALDARRCPRRAKGA